MVYFLLALYQPSDLWIIGMAIVSEYLGYGFGFVGLMLFMMQQVAPGKHQMAHYAFANRKYTKNGILKAQHKENKVFRSPKAEM